MEMKELLYALYILMWPALTLGVLIHICRAVWRDARRARRNQEDLI